MQSQQQSGQAGRQAPASGPATALLRNYMPPLGAFDEVLGPDGRLRPRYQPFLEQLDRLGAEEIDRRWARSRRLVHENGVAYSPHGGQDAPRPWMLDPFPLLVEKQEWRVVVEGLTQRAKLLDLVLKDLFGPQRLIRDKVLPAEVLFAHPGYLAPLRNPGGQQEGVAPPGPSLRFYSADLGRSPDGAWWVLTDRTEAPSGVGFALENRIVLSRMFPEPFRECRVRRMAPFFLRLRETLAQIAPGSRRNPRVAILSQGPGHPNYFEDAYLARYLGYTLVEGGDLTVRNRRLWLKTLEGLTPIDVLLRRPNTEVCDPLELGGESPAGVAGLIQATRDDGLAVANPLGSGLVESPVFMAFMPKLCHALLGEELKLPGVASWWCGDPDSLGHVLKNLDRLVLKKAYRRRGKESSIFAEMDSASQDALIQMVKEDPKAFVAQERVQRSSAPALRNGRLEPARVALRAFAVESAGQFHVLEGGLARTSTPQGLPGPTAVQSEGSKDVWVVSDEPVEPVTLLPDEDTQVELVRFGAELPSRVADDSYWLGRQLERADAKARLLRIVAGRLTGEGQGDELPELPALLRALVEQGQVEPGYAVEEMRRQLPPLEKALPSQVLNLRQDDSLGATVQRVFRVASKVRDRLSRDTWRIVLRLRDLVDNPEGGISDLTDLLNLTDELIVNLSAIGGMVVESMTRTQFYRFLDIGRRIERAMQAADLLSATLIESPSTSRPLLEAILEACDSLMTYRSRYRANLLIAPVLDLLVTDNTNPRSLAFQLETLHRHVGKLPNNTDEGSKTDPDQRLALSLTHAVKMVNVEELTDAHELGQSEVLAGLLAQVRKELPALSDAVSLKYLVHSGPPRQLSPL